MRRLCSVSDPYGNPGNCYMTPRLKVSVSASRTSARICLRLLFTERHKFSEISDIHSLRARDSLRRFRKSVVCSLGWRTPAAVAVAICVVLVRLLACAGVRGRGVWGRAVRRAPRAVVRGSSAASFWSCGACQRVSCNGNCNSLWLLASGFWRAGACCVLCNPHLHYSL
jgi:hypothetical protein